MVSFSAIFGTVRLMSFLNICSYAYSKHFALFELQAIALGPA